MHKGFYLCKQRGTRPLTVITSLLSSNQSQHLVFTQASQPYKGKYADHAVHMLHK